MSKSSNAKFNDLRKQVGDVKISHVAVKLPIKHLGKGEFEFADGTRTRMTIIGAGYWHERIKDVPYRWWTSAARDSQWGKIADKINANAAIFTKDKYIVAMVDGKMVGIMANYQAVDHAALLDQLQGLGLDKDLAWGELDETKLTAVVRVDGVGDDVASPDLLVGLKVVNGHSGHVALRFFVYAQVGAYEFMQALGEGATGGRARHLTTVGKVVSNLELAAKAAAELKLIDRLSAISVGMARATIASNFAPNGPQKLTLRQERMLAEVDDDKSIATALDLVVRLGQFSSTRGYGAAVSGLVDPVIELAVGAGDPALAATA